MHDQLLLARNAYAYPFAGLDVNEEHLEFGSVVDLDTHHYQLLRSERDRDVLAGYYSVLYWGFYSGQDGVIRAPRAKGLVNKAKRKLSELNDPETFVAGLIRGAASLIDSRHPGHAVLLLTHLPQMQFSFASKVAAFLNPGCCGVSDSIIANGYPDFGFRAKESSVDTEPRNAVAYDKYCQFLERVANAMNGLGPGHQWEDQDSTRHRWRALDVERALFKSLEEGFSTLRSEITAEIRENL